MEFDKLFCWSKCVVFIQSIFLSYLVRILLSEYWHSFKVIKWYCSLVEKWKYFIYNSLCVNTSGQQSGHTCSFGSSALCFYNPPCRNCKLLLLHVCHSNVVLTKMSAIEARLTLAICLVSLGKSCSSWNKTGHRLYSTAVVAEPVGFFHNRSIL